MIGKMAIRLLSPGAGKGKLLTFIFHRVLEKQDALLDGVPDAEQFRWMVRQIGKNFNVLPFGLATELLKKGKLPAAAACITFDDGYRDNFTVALPVLRQYGVCATFFIATAFLGGGRMWNDDIIEAVRAWNTGVADWSRFGLDQYELGTLADRRDTINAVLDKVKYFPCTQREAVARQIARCAGVDERSDLMMSADDVRAIRAAGMEVGGHTHSHPILGSVGDDEAFAEIVRGKDELESILSERVDVFAYPNGNPRLDFAARHVDMLKVAGFRAAATTESGVGTVLCDPFMMPRFTPWDRTPARFATRCALALAGRYSIGEQEKAHGRAVKTGRIVPGDD